MSFKVLLFVCCVATVCAIELKKAENENVEYTFSYAVNDKHTGDIKSQKESRKDDKVEGQYELIDSDGYRRIVQYKADDHNGFQAIVLREPTDIKIPIPVPQKIVATKIITHQPLVQYIQKAEIQKQTPDLGQGSYVSYSGPLSNYKY